MCTAEYLVCNNFRTSSASHAPLCTNPTVDLPYPHMWNKVICPEARDRGKNHPHLIPRDWELGHWGICKTKRDEFRDEKWQRYGTPVPGPVLGMPGAFCTDCKAKAKAAEIEKDRGVKIKKEEDDDGDQQGGWGGAAAAPSGIALKG